MQSPEATLYCSNPGCQAPNPESHRFCQQCRTALPKRYLWAVGVGSETFQAGHILAERYFCKHPRIFLDTKPGQLPESPLEVTAAIAAYLRLAVYPLNLPQVYAAVPLPSLPDHPILLLERAPIQIANIENGSAHQPEDFLQPALSHVWRRSGALQQLHWLWQMARLWEPLRREGVANSLLNPSMVRVEGSLLRLLELQSDGDPPPTLSVFGKLSEFWLAEAHPAIAPFLGQLCQQIQQGQVNSIEQVIWLFDQAITHCSVTQTRQIQLATLSDQGPTRQRNEDACYPPSGTTKTITIKAGKAPTEIDELPLVVVCDGIGGQEGGNIASNLAIATVQQHLQQITVQATQLEPADLMAELGQTVLAANDAIVRRNDTEQRHDRRRMGTTLVMGLCCDHELYLAHVGDSRAYRITRSGCYQITMDDDLASREVRMGYALYRDALLQPSSGSLVQALGMNPSQFLRPTVQRFLLDEDCLFLLCSDGLSDNDRVEEQWHAVLLPVLEGKQDLATVSHQLVAIANQQNGHDNVTVGLIACRISPTGITLPAVSAAIFPESDSPQPAALDPVSSPVSSTLKTQNMLPDPEIGQSWSEVSPSRSRLPAFLLGLLAILGLGGLAAFFLLPYLTPFQTPLSSSPSPSVTPSLSPAPSPSVVSPSPATTATLPVRARVLVNRASVDGTGAIPVMLLATVPLGSQPIETRSVPVGSVLEIVDQQILEDRRWLRFKVCSLPSVPTATRELVRAAQPTVHPGDTGWIQESAIAPVITTNFSLTPSQVGQCSVGRS